MKINDSICDLSVCTERKHINLPIYLLCKRRQNKYSYQTNDRRTWKTYNNHPKILHNYRKTLIVQTNKQ